MHELINGSAGLASVADMEATKPVNSGFFSSFFLAKPMMMIKTSLAGEFSACSSASLLNGA